MKHSILLKSLLAVAILTTSYLPDAYAAFSFGEVNGYQDVTMNASDVGQSFTANWLCSANTTCNNPKIVYPSPVNLSATGIFTLDQYGSNYVKISATIKNTTISSFQAALMSIGLSTQLSNSNISPSWNIPGDSGSQGTIFKSYSSPGNFPGGFSGINACFWSGKNCSGGPISKPITSGLGNGYPKLGPSTDSFTFFLTSNTGTIGSSLTLSDFAVKFQTQAGSYEFGDGLGPSPTPEPGSFWLLGSALLAMIGFSLRKTMPKKA